MAGACGRLPFDSPTAKAMGRPPQEVWFMASIHEIEHAIHQLSPTDLSAFRQWFAEFDAGVWDRQFEQDVATGKLGDLADEAVRDFKEGRCTDL